MSKWWHNVHFLGELSLSFGVKYDLDILHERYQFTLRNNQYPSRNKRSIIDLIQSKDRDVDKTDDAWPLQPRERLLSIYSCYFALPGESLWWRQKTDKYRRFIFCLFTSVMICFFLLFSSCKWFHRSWTYTERSSVVEHKLSMREKLEALRRLSSTSLKAQISMSAFAEPRAAMMSLYRSV